MVSPMGCGRAGHPCTRQLHRKKGNREPRLQDWEYEEINAAMAEYYDTELRGSESADISLAEPAIKYARAQKEGLTISPWRRRYWERMLLAASWRDAKSTRSSQTGSVVRSPIAQSRTSASAPIGDYPLAEAEVDRALTSTSSLFMKTDRPGSADPGSLRSSIAIHVDHRLRYFICSALVASGNGGAAGSGST